ncbi:MAG: cytochrome ubiquinol oxidase subunit II [Pseudomonadota bacterium]|nr:cytochrome ubiquinol oxidase subunit II [Pseudomonadota bacterium]
MDRSGLSFAACRRAALCALLGTLSGCSSAGQNFLTPDGPVAAAQYHHLVQVVLIMLVVVVPVLLGVPLLAWRYRAGNTRARYLPEWDFSTALEWPMWLVPTAVLIALSVLLWRNTQRLDPYRPIASARAPLTVEVVGLDWKWLFIYPQYHIATVGELAFPQDRPLALRLTSDTVMQSFMIPALGGQIYAMPGMVTQLHLAAAHPGRFGGLNTQYDGRGFHAEQFAAVAMRPHAFARWVGEVEHRGVPLGPATYARLGLDSTPRQVHAEFRQSAAPAEVTYFRAVAPGMFHAILERYRRGTPLPRFEQPGTAAYGVAHASGGQPR